MVQLPLITKEELIRSAESDRVLVTVGNRKVYDVTEFLDGHPGGGDLISKFAGKDVLEAMKDVESHEHSEAAYEMLDEDYLVALVATDLEARELIKEGARELYTVLDPATAMTIRTDYKGDYEKHKFLDLNKALLPQMLFGKFTREFYITQIHKPRHYGNGSAPIFGNFLEPLSLTPWYVVPILWIPGAIYALSICMEGLSLPKVIPTYMLGLLIWTLLEYILHRFLFHLDDHLPENQIAFTLHFLLHGVHHFLPMDGMRLVMPPALLVVLTTPLYHLAHLLFPYYYAMGIFAGAFSGYICYDCSHYFLHHAKLPSFLQKQKTWHLDHHYKDYQRGFGVTSSLWDRVFGTTFVDRNTVF